MATTCRCLVRSLRNIARVTLPFKVENTYAVSTQSLIHNKWHANFVRNYSVTAVNSKGNAEALASASSVDDFMKLQDEEKDVYVIGMPYKASLEDMKRFFEGLSIQDIFFMDINKTKLKKICYVRFKDAENKQKALERNKKTLQDRYLEVVGIKQDLRLGYSFLRQNSSVVKIRNLPFEVTKADVMKWLHPVPVDAENIVFISRGKCVVDLKSAENVDEAVKKDFDKLNDRAVRIEAFITRDALKELQQKYKT